MATLLASVGSSRRFGGAGTGPQELLYGQLQIGGVHERWMNASFSIGGEPQRERVMDFYGQSS